MGLWSGVTGALDDAAGSTDEAVGRQFDDEQGGGFIDEGGALLDPTRGASGQTERDFRGLLDAGGLTQHAGALRLLDGADVLGGTVPGSFDRVPDDETPSGDGALWSGSIGSVVDNSVAAVVPDLPYRLIAYVTAALVGVVAFGQLFTVGIGTEA